MTDASFTQRFSGVKYDHRVVYNAMTDSERSALLAVLESDGRAVDIEDSEAASTLLALNVIGGGHGTYRPNPSTAMMYAPYFPPGVIKAPAGYNR